jgi:hypothetical protein
LPQLKEPNYLPATDAVSAASYLRRQRIGEFHNELITLNFQPREDEVRSKEFIEAFLETASRVQQTRREEKIKLLARLFRTFWSSGKYTAEAFDLYEQDLSVLDETDLHEFYLLTLLHDFEVQFPPLVSENHAQRTAKYWKEFQTVASTRLGIEPIELESYLQRVSRTGLYQPLTGAFWDYTGGRGYLTSRFYRLKDKIDERVHTAPEN